MLALIASPALSATPSFLPPVSQVQPGMVPFEESSYVLGAGDRLQIDLFDVPEYSGENGRRQVLVDGTVNLPLLGSVSVRGMSLRQAESELSRRYARFFKRSAVTVTLLTPRPALCWGFRRGKPSRYLYHPASEPRWRHPISHTDTGTANGWWHYPGGRCSAGANSPSTARGCSPNYYG
jgi:polysaccharide export outer membrane protein